MVIESTVTYHVKLPRTNDKPDGGESRRFLPAKESGITRPDLIFRLQTQTLKGTTQYCFAGTPPCVRVWLVNSGICVQSADKHSAVDTASATTWTQPTL